MKLYSYQPAPNPRRTRIFLAEKGLDIPIVEVDLRAGEQHDDAFREKNPCLTVPTLELDDGSCIGETMAICRYLEELHPDPSMLGADPLQRAMVTWWIRRIEFEGMMALAEALRNHSEFFAGRALPGPHAVEQLPQLVPRGLERARSFFELLDDRLAQSRNVAGPDFSMADITAMVTVDFAGWVKLDAQEGRPNIANWYQRNANRPSMAA